MAENSRIAWCDHSFNPWWGCEQISPGCARCYAKGFAHRMGFDLWGEDHGFRFFDDKHWAEPLKWNAKAEREGVRYRVFAGSMCDVFEERAELEEPRARLLDLVEETPHLDWLLLTKRPEAMAEAIREFYWGDYRVLPNLWLGVTIENARFSYRADILREIPAAVRFISAEPLLGPLICPECKGAGEYMGMAHAPGCDGACRTGCPVPTQEQCFCDALHHQRSLDLTGIDWLIAGCESGSKRRPMEIEWVRELRDACLAPCDFYGCMGGWVERPDRVIGELDDPCPDCDGRGHRSAFFFKQAHENGRMIECPELDGRRWMEYPGA